MDECKGVEGKLNVEELDEVLDLVKKIANEEISGGYIVISSDGDSDMAMSLIKNSNWSVLKTVAGLLDAVEDRELNLLQLIISMRVNKTGIYKESE